MTEITLSTRIHSSRIKEIKYPNEKHKFVCRTGIPTTEVDFLRKVIFGYKFEVSARNYYGAYINISFVINQLEYVREGCWCFASSTHGKKGYIQFDKGGVSAYLVGLSSNYV